MCRETSGASPTRRSSWGGDRADIQLVALETSTRCLILTGNIRPSQQILSRAQDRSVPVVLAHYDTMTAIGRIERFFGKTRFHQEKKIRRFEALPGEHMDFRGLKKELGL
ncbi:MAG: DRTGG domain-containing protein [bacterium]